MQTRETGLLATSLIVAPSTYEIHYVLHGNKRVKLHDSYSMTECTAWVLAALDGGVAPELIPTRLYLSVLKTLAESQGITKVRWNLCPRTLQYR